MTVKIEDKTPILVEEDIENNTVFVNVPVVAADDAMAVIIKELQNHITVRLPEFVRDDESLSDEPLGDQFGEIFSDAKIQVNYIDKYEGTNIPTSLRTVYIAGEMAGIGMLISPWAVINLGWIGFALLFIVGAITAYSGNLLGRCWLLLNERNLLKCSLLPYPNPYKTIASIAMGKNVSYLTTACVQTTLFGAATVYLLLLAQSAQHLFAISHPEISFGTWIFVFAITLSSLMFLEDPREFRLVAGGTMIMTMATCCLVVIQMILDSKVQATKHSNYVWNENQFFLSLGAILFSFGAASAFPTIQNDRYKKYEYSSSLIATFSTLAVLFGLVVAGAYLVYGDAIKPNVLLSLGKNSWMTQGAIILMVIHLMLSFVITANPVSRHFESFFNIPDAFCMKKFVLRMFLLLGMLFLAQSVRKFSVIVALIGSITIALTTFVLPPIFYIRLCSMKNEIWPPRKISCKSKFILFSVVIAGLGAIALALTTTVYHIMDLKSIIEPYLVTLIPAEII